MNESNIKLIINSTNDRGYSQVSLMVGKTLGDMKDCGALFLSQEELTIISDALISGFTENSKAVFSIEDKTLVGEY